MKRSVRHILLLSFALFCLVVFATASFSAMPTSENEQIFKWLVGDTTKTPSLTTPSKGLTTDLTALRYFAEGDLELASKAWLEIVRQRSNTTYSIEPILALLNMVERFSPSADGLRALSKDSSVIFSSVNRRDFFAALFDVAAYLGDNSLAIETGRSLGLVENWNSVVGPFGYAGASDLDERFYPEKEPLATSFTGWAGPVSPRSATCTLSGFLNLNSFLYPESGVAYAMAGFSAKHAAETSLEFHTRAGLCVWWNGRLVLRRNPYDLDLPTRIPITVSVAEGRNWLMVKTMNKDSSWNFRAFVDGLGDWIQPDSLPSNAKVHPDYASFIKQRESSPWLRLESSTSLLPEGPKDSLWLVSRFYATAIARRKNDFRTARDLLTEIVSRWPKCALAQRLLGDVYLAWADEQSGSRSRLENHAAESYNKALALCPDDFMAAGGLSSFHFDRKAYDTGLSILEAQRSMWEKRHNDKPLPDSLAYNLALVCEAKKYEFDQERYFLIALESSGSVSQLAAASLINFYLSKNAQTKAAEVAKKALSLRLDLSPGSAYSALYNAFPLGSPERADTLNRISTFLRCNRDLYMSLGNSYAAASEWTKAEDAYKTASAICPNAPEPWSRLAELALSEAKKTGQVSSPSTEAILLLQESAKRQNSSNARDKILMTEIMDSTQTLNTSAQSATTKLTPWFSRFDLTTENTKDFPEAPLERYSQSSSVYLEDAAVVRFNIDGSYEMLTRQEVKILNQKGIDQWAEVSIPGSSSSTRIVSAFTSNEKDGVLLPGQVTEMNNARALSMPGVQVGSTIEFSYIEEKSAPDSAVGKYWQQSFQFGAKEDATYLSKFVLLLPKGLAANWTVHPASFTPTITEVSAEESDQGGPYTAYTWFKMDVPGVRNENNSPSISELVNSVKISNCPEHVVAMRRASVFSTGKNEPDPVFLKVAQSLDVANKTPLEKTSAVYQWIQTNIRDSAGAYRTDLDTLEMSEGSAFERSLLAQTLLRELGVSSKIEFSFDPIPDDGHPPIPLPDRYGTALLSVPDVGGRTRLFDFQSQYFSPLETNPKSLKGFLLSTSSLGYSVRPAEAKSVDSGWIERRLDFTLTEPETTSVAGALSYEGLYRPTLRQLMEDKRVAQRLVDQQVAQRLLGLTVSEVSPEIVPGLAPSISFKGKVPRFLVALQNAGSASPDYDFNPVTDLAELAEYVREATRETPIKFNSWEAMMPYEATFALPSPSSSEPCALSGYAFAEVPDDEALLSEFGVFTLTYRVIGNNLHVKRSLLIPSQEISPEDYERFIAFCKAVDEAEKRRVVARKY